MLLIFCSTIALAQSTTGYDPNAGHLPTAIVKYVGERPSYRVSVPAYVYATESEVKNKICKYATDPDKSSAKRTDMERVCINDFKRAMRQLAEKRNSCWHIVAYSTHFYCGQTGNRCGDDARDMCVEQYKGCRYDKVGALGRCNSFNNSGNVVDPGGSCDRRICEDEVGGGLFGLDNDCPAIRFATVQEPDCKQYDEADESGNVKCPYCHENRKEDTTRDPVSDPDNAFKIISQGCFPDDGNGEGASGGSEVGKKLPLKGVADSVFNGAIGDMFDAINDIDVKIPKCLKIPVNLVKVDKFESNPDADAAKIKIENAYSKFSATDETQDGQYRGACGRGVFFYQDKEGYNSNLVLSTEVRDYIKSKRAGDNDIWTSRTGCYNPEERFVHIPPYANFKRDFLGRIRFYEPSSKRFNAGVVSVSEGPWDEPMVDNGGGTSGPSLTTKLIPHDRLLMNHPLCERSYGLLAYDLACPDLFNAVKSGDKAAIKSAINTCSGIPRVRDEIGTPIAFSLSELTGTNVKDGSFATERRIRKSDQRRVFEYGSLPRCYVDGSVDDMDAFCHNYVKYKWSLDIDELADSFRYRKSRYAFNFQNFCWDRSGAETVAGVTIPYEKYVYPPDPYEQWMPQAIRADLTIDNLTPQDETVDRQDIFGRTHRYFRTHYKRYNFTPYAQRQLTDLGNVIMVDTDGDGKYDKPIYEHIIHSLEEYGFRDIPLMRRDYAYDPLDIYGYFANPTQPASSSGASSSSSSSSSSSGASSSSSSSSSGASSSSGSPAPTRFSYEALEKKKWFGRKYKYQQCLKLYIEQWAFEGDRGSILLDSNILLLRAMGNTFVPDASMCQWVVYYDTSENQNFDPNLTGVLSGTISPKRREFRGIVADFFKKIDDDVEEATESKDYKISPDLLGMEAIRLSGSANGAKIPLVDINFAQNTYGSLNTRDMIRRRHMEPELWDYQNFLTFSSMRLATEKMDFTGIKLSELNDIMLGDVTNRLSNLDGELVVDPEEPQIAAAELYKVGLPSQASGVIFGSFEPGINMSGRECNTESPPHLWKDAVQPVFKSCNPNVGGKMVDNLMVSLTSVFGDNPPKFIKKIVDFMNDKVGGGLNSSIGFSHWMTTNINKPVLSIVTPMPTLAVWGIGFDSEGPYVAHDNSDDPEDKDEEGRAHTPPDCGALLNALGEDWKPSNCQRYHTNPGSGNNYVSDTPWDGPGFEIRDNMYRAGGKGGFPYHLFQKKGVLFYPNSKLGVPVLQTETDNEDPMENGVAYLSSKDWVEHTWPAGTCMHMPSPEMSNYLTNPDYEADYLKEDAWRVRDDIAADDLSYASQPPPACNPKVPPSETDWTTPEIPIGWEANPPMPPADFMPIDSSLPGFIAEVAERARMEAWRKKTWRDYVWEYSCKKKFLKEGAILTGHRMVVDIDDDNFGNYESNKNFGGIHVFDEIDSYKFKWLPNSYSLGVGMSKAFWCEFRLPYNTYYIGADDEEFNSTDILSHFRVNAQSDILLSTPLRPDKKPKLEYLRVERIRDACGPFSSRSTWIDDQETHLSKFLFSIVLDRDGNVDPTMARKYRHQAEMIKGRCAKWNDLYGRKTNNPKIMAYRLPRFDYEFLKSFIECTGPIAGSHCPISPCRYQPEKRKKNIEAAACEGLKATVNYLLPGLGVTEPSIQCIMKGDFGEEEGEDSGQGAGGMNLPRIEMPINLPSGINIDNLGIKIPNMGDLGFGSGGKLNIGNGFFKDGKITIGGESFNVSINMPEIDLGNGFIINGNGITTPLGQITLSPDGTVNIPGGASFKNGVLTFGGKSYNVNLPDIAGMLGSTDCNANPDSLYCRAIGAAKDWISIINTALEAVGLGSIDASGCLFRGCVSDRSAIQQAINDTIVSLDYITRGDTQYSYGRDDNDLRDLYGFENPEEHSTSRQKWWLGDNGGLGGDDRFGFWCICAPDDPRSTRCREDMCTVEQHVISPGRDFTVFTGVFKSLLDILGIGPKDGLGSGSDKFDIENAGEGIRPLAIASDYGPFRRWLWCYHQARAKACPVLTREVSNETAYATSMENFQLDKRVKDNLAETSAKGQSVNVCSGSSPMGFGTPEVEDFLRWTREEPNDLALLPLFAESAGSGFKHNDLVFQTQVRDVEGPWVESVIPFPIDLVTRQFSSPDDTQWFDEKEIQGKTYKLPKNRDKGDPILGISRTGERRTKFNNFDANGRKYNRAEDTNMLSELQQREGTGYQIDYFNSGTGEAAIDEFKADSKNLLKFKSVLLKTRDRGTIAPVYSSLGGQADDSDAYKALYRKYIEGLYAVSYSNTFTTRPEYPKDVHDDLPSPFNTSTDKRRKVHPYAQSAVVGPRGCDIGGWYEMMLYQARCIRWFKLNCICDYDKTFARGDAPNYVLKRAGGKVKVATPKIRNGAFETAEVVDGPTGASLIEKGFLERDPFGNARGFLDELFNAFKKDETTDKTEQRIIKGIDYDEATGRAKFTNKLKNTDIDLTVKVEEIDVPLVSRGIMGPDYALNSGTQFKLEDLDNVQVGDFITFDETLRYNPSFNGGIDPGFPRHIAYVEKVQRYNGKDEDKKGKPVMIEVSEMNWGKNLDSCGNTNMWGIDTRRKIYRPTCSSNDKTCPIGYWPEEPPSLGSIPIQGIKLGFIEINIGADGIPTINIPGFGDIGIGNGGISIGGVDIGFDGSISVPLPNLPGITFNPDCSITIAGIITLLPNGGIAFPGGSINANGSITIEGVTIGVDNDGKFYISIPGLAGNLPVLIDGSGKISINIGNPPVPVGIDANNNINLGGVVSLSPTGGLTFSGGLGGISMGSSGNFNLPGGVTIGQNNSINFPNGISINSNNQVSFAIPGYQGFNLGNGQFNFPNPPGGGINANGSFTLPGGFGISNNGQITMPPGVNLPAVNVTPNGAITVGNSGISVNPDNSISFGPATILPNGNIQMPGLPNGMSLGNGTINVPGYNNPPISVNGQINISGIPPQGVNVPLEGGGTMHIGPGGVITAPGLPASISPQQNGGFNLGSDLNINNGNINLGGGAQAGGVTIGNGSVNLPGGISYGNGELIVPELGNPLGLNPDGSVTIGSATYQNGTLTGNGFVVDANGNISTDSGVGLQNGNLIMPGGDIFARNPDGSIRLPAGLGSIGNGKITIGTGPDAPQIGADGSLTFPGFANLGRQADGSIKIAGFTIGNGKIKTPFGIELGANGSIKIPPGITLSNNGSLSGIPGFSSIAPPYYPIPLPGGAGHIEPGRIVLKDGTVIECGKVKIPGKDDIGVGNGGITGIPNFPISWNGGNVNIGGNITLPIGDIIGGIGTIIGNIPGLSTIGTIHRYADCQNTDWAVCVLKNGYWNQVKIYRPFTFNGKDSDGKPKIEFDPEYMGASCNLPNNTGQQATTGVILPKPLGLNELTRIAKEHLTGFDGYEKSTLDNSVQVVKLGAARRYLMQKFKEEDPNFTAEKIMYGPEGLWKLLIPNADLGTYAYDDMANYMFNALNGSVDRCDPPKEFRIDQIKVVEEDIKTYCNISQNTTDEKCKAFEK